MMYVTVSKPRCGCHGVPLGSPGAYSTSPIWSMCTNGSRSLRLTPANARRTGNPSPSKPEGAVVTRATGRSPSTGGTVTRGRTSRLGTVTAGMMTLLALDQAPIPGAPGSQQPEHYMTRHHSAVRELTTRKPNNKGDPAQ